MAEISFDLDDPLLAAIAWSRIAEPADKAAGALARVLGHADALRWLSGAPVLLSHLPGSERDWQAARARWLPRLEGLDPLRELRTITTLGGGVLHRADPRWPSAVDDLGLEAPHCLWVRGDPELVARESSVAIVGARTSTHYGERVASELAAGLAGRGHVVVSGGAYGIDAAAHRAALAAQGPTIAVMAGGLDRFYPAGNAELIAAIAQDGAVISELAPGSSPSRSRFLTRNRLIAALASACIVVEAGWRSGTLSTAGHAAGLLRPVGVVPGPVTSAASAGCHRLLREGNAVCVTDLQEVLELVSPVGEVVQDEPESHRATDAPRGLSQGDTQVWEALPARGSGTLTSVTKVSGLGLDSVRAALGRLEMLGHATREGERFRRARR